MIPAAFLHFSLKKRLGVALACGALLSLAMPPAGIWPLIFLCLPLFAHLCQTAPRQRDALLCGLSFAIGFFTIGLYWISFALLTDALRWGWLIPFSALGLPLILAPFTLPVAWAAWRSRSSSPVFHVPLLATLWALGEWARGHWFSGFPWHLLAHSTLENPALSQGFAWFGSYSYSLLLAMLGFSPLFWLTQHRHRKTVLVLCIASLTLLYGAGSLRLALNPIKLRADIPVRLLQPSIPQDEKHRDDNALKNFESHLRLAASPSQSGSEPPRIIIWPEAAILDLLAERPLLRLAIAGSTPPDAVSIVGTLRRDSLDNFYNAILVIDHNGKVTASYDKAHLVPFGEYMPFRRWIPLRAIAASDTDFSAGEGAQTLPLPGGLPGFGGLVCYEAIFPHRVTDTRNRPEFLVNVTNDAWYGKTAGPWQHLAIARARSLEEGLPMLRAANSGITAVIDSLGRIVAHTESWNVTALDSFLPAPLPSTSLGCKFPGITFLLAVFFNLGIMISSRFRFFL